MTDGYYMNGDQKTIAACACQLQSENPYPEMNSAFSRMVSEKYPHARFSMEKLSDRPHWIEDALLTGFGWATR